MKNYTVNIQGVDKNISYANGSYDAIVFDNVSPSKTKELLNKMLTIVPLPPDSEDRCPVSITIENPNGRQSSYYIENENWHNADTESMVSIDDIMQGRQPAPQNDKRQKLKADYLAEGISPRRKPDIPPTDRMTLSDSDINTNNVKTELKIWKSRRRYEGAISGPIGIFIFFAFVGLIVLGEQRDADMAPLMFAIAIAGLLLWFPLSRLGQTLVYCGTDWITNTIWIKSKNGKLFYYEYDANYIDDFIPVKGKRGRWFVIMKRRTDQKPKSFKELFPANRRDAEALSKALSQALNR